MHTNSLGRKSGMYGLTVQVVCIARSHDARVTAWPFAGGLDVSITYHRRDPDGLLCDSAADDGAKMYVLRSLLPTPLRDAFVDPPGAANNRAFAMTVLGLLSIARNKLSEEVCRGCAILVHIGRHAVFAALPLHTR